VNKRKSLTLCPICSGRKKPGTTTFTVDLEFGVVVVRKVPATVCGQCGADWIEDRIARQLEDIVKDARKRRLQVEVTSLSWVASHLGYNGEARQFMAYNAKKTEHAGPKKGAGAYYGRKSFAKKASNRRRRENNKNEILTHGTSQT
jgi:YgiT-type zinc finger domain-containing protein